MPTKETVNKFVGMVEQGQIMEAYERFYAEEVKMQENLNSPTVGKDANRKREEEFVASVAKVNKNKAKAVVVDGDNVAINWVFDFQNTEGDRVVYDQIALQEWNGDKIVSERFVYDTGNNN